MSKVTLVANCEILPITTQKRVEMFIELLSKTTSAKFARSVKRRFNFGLGEWLTTLDLQHYIKGLLIAVFALPFMFLTPVLAQGSPDVIRAQAATKLGVTNVSVNGEALVAYALHGNIAKVKEAINEGVDVNYQVKATGVSPLIATTLYQLSMSNSAIIAKVLIDNGANVNLRLNNRKTALMVAAKNGNVDIVRLLIDSGARLEDGDEADWTALDYANAAGKTEIERLLKQATAGGQELFDAARNGYSKKVAELISQGVNINYQEMSKGGSALSAASEIGYSAIVNMLIDKGAKLDLQSKSGATALYLAAQSGFTNIVKLLIDKGAKLDLTTDKGATALTVAASQGNTDIVKMLIDKGADLNVKGRLGSEVLTPLDAAREWGNSNTVRLLESAGAKSAKESKVTTH